MKITKATQPLPRLARIFRAMQGDHDAQAVVTFAEIELYRPAETFEGFLEVNQLPVYETVLRQ